MNTLTHLRAVAFALLLAACSLVFAAPGQLDSSFGSGGEVITPSAFQAVAARVAVQPDGKIVVAGYCFSGGSNQACLMRYLPSGALDTSFDGDGIRIESFGTASAFGVGLAVQRDGKIVLAALCSNAATPAAQFCLSRHQGNGALDTSFGVNGRVVAGIGNRRDAPASLVIDTQGRILVGGVCNVFVILGFADVLCVARYLPNGAPDESFGIAGAGYALATNGSSPTSPAIALSSDDKIIVAAMCKPSSAVPPQPCVSRLRSNGSADTSFNGSGRVITPISTRDVDEIERGIYSALVQPDKKIVIAGRCVSDVDTGLDTRACLLRYNEDGSLDTPFGVIGTALFEPRTPSAEDFIAAMTLQADGKVVAAGRCGSAAFCVWRVRSDGKFDISFSGDGVASATPGTLTDSASAVALQADGKIVVAGECRGADNILKFCLARIEGGPDSAALCSLDLDGDGTVSATVDTLLWTRLSRGMSGPSVVNGITFSSLATRRTWEDIRRFANVRCGMSLAP